MVGSLASCSPRHAELHLCVCLIQMSYPDDSTADVAVLTPSSPTLGRWGVQHAMPGLSMVRPALHPSFPKICPYSPPDHPLATTPHLLRNRNSLGGTSPGINQELSFPPFLVFIPVLTPRTPLRPEPFRHAVSLCFLHLTYVFLLCFSFTLPRLSILSFSPLFATTIPCSTNAHANSCRDLSYPDQSWRSHKREVPIIVCKIAL